MIKKRTILIVGIIIGSILLIGPLGLSPVFLIVGVVLSIIIGQKGDVAAAKFIRHGQVTITEIRGSRQQKTEDRARPDTPTVPITGHFKPIYDEPPEPTPAPDTAFIIGTTEDGRQVTLKELGGMGVGGRPGSGKSVAVVGLCTQAVSKYRGDIRFLVVDPHTNVDSLETISARMAPLAPFYLNVPNLPNPVYGGDDLLKWIKWFSKMAYDRIHGVEGVGTMKFVLVIDEFTALLDDPEHPEIAERLIDLLVLINEQARKVRMFALVASPTWKSSRIQGTDIRNTLSAFLVHNMPPSIAYQLIPFAEANQSNRLDVGQAIFSTFGQVETVRVPFMTPEDIADCVEPYLPVEPLYPVSDPFALDARLLGEPVAELDIDEIRLIWDTYQQLNKELNHSEDSTVHALAIHFSISEDRVRRALKKGEKHF